MDSRISKEKECWFCGSRRNLEYHHIYFGNPNRKNSDELGLTVWLCYKHHRGEMSVHQDREKDLQIKKVGQIIFEREIGNRELFIKTFGRNYL